MITIGQVGLGKWGPNVLRNFANLPGCRVKICCDLDEAALARARASYPGILVAQEYGQLLDDPETIRHPSSRP